VGFLPPLLFADSVAQATLVLALVAALGLALGSVRIYSVKLGIAGVLFVGLAFGQCHVTINDHILEFAREFGLILFVYTIGLQVGPGILNSLRRDGLPLNLLAASVVLLGVAATVLTGHLLHIPMPAALGLYAGANTNTPSLAAAQQALHDLGSAPPAALQWPSLAYAVSYPIGLFSSVISILLIRTLFRVDPAQEATALEQSGRATAALDAINLEVKQAAGRSIRELLAQGASKVAISRRWRAHRMEVPHLDDVLEAGDILLAIGARAQLEKLTALVGPQSTLDLRTLASSITYRQIIVTHKAVLGKTIEELDLIRRHGVAITRVIRAEIEFAATPRLRLQFGDTVRAVGEEAALNAVSEELGNSPQALNHPQVVPVFLGIGLGVVLGSWPIYLPHVPAPVKLGLAGGPLLSAICLSRIGRIGRLTWYMPVSANFMLRELGIVLFLSCVGLKAGDQFVQTLLHGGLVWVGGAALISIPPLLLVAALVRAALKMNYVTLCGLMAGSRTDPPALAFANQLSGSDRSSVPYATVYPLVMLLRILTAQLLVLLWR
jgi:putative transport protein